jgi:hypothetical protein
MESIGTPVRTAPIARSPLDSARGRRRTTPSIKMNHSQTCMQTCMSDHSYTFDSMQAHKVILLK